MYAYSNLRSTRNDSGGNFRTAELKENRSTAIINNPNGSGNFLTAIDRFAIEHAVLPLFQHHEGSDLKIRITDQNGANEQIETIDFSPYIDSNGFGYSYFDFLRALNTALSGLTLTGNLSFKLSSDSHLIITSDDSFNTNHRLYVNILWLSNFGFDYEGLHDLTKEYYRIFLNDGDNKSLENMNALSPVDKLILTSNLSVHPESTTVDGEFSKSKSVILTDYQVKGTNPYMIHSIHYTALDGQYRLQTLNGHVTDTYDVKFKFTDFSGKEYDLKILNTGKLDMKIMFKKAE